MPAFLILFLTIPVANAIPYMKTIYISFAQQESLSSASQKEVKPITRSKAEQVQSISKPEIMEIKDRQDEFLLNEKPVTAAVQRAENLIHSENGNHKHRKSRKSGCRGNDIRKFRRPCLYPSGDACLSFISKEIGQRGEGRS